MRRPSRLDGGGLVRFQNGYVKLYRSTLYGDIGKNPYLLTIWVLLLLWATWKETKIIWNGKQRVLAPGSVVFGVREIADKLDVSPATVSKWLKYLHESERIVLETGTHGSLATICNWKEYQSNEDRAETPSEHQVNAKCTPSEHQVNLIEEVKKERKKELNTAEFQKCLQAWGKTLQKFGIKKDPRVDEVSIVRLIEQYGAARAEQALYGAGFEDKTDTFNPAKNVRISRLFTPKLFEKFENLGSQNEPVAREFHNPEDTAC